MINDIPGFRTDHMPYGGIKDSGLGREGVKYAMMDMLEPKIMVKSNTRNIRSPRLLLTNISHFKK